MLNKEEIEKAKTILLKEDGFYNDETEIKATKVLLKYINELEQKESVLNTVTDKLKEDANKKIPLAEDMDWVRCRKEHAKEILNIIEGEKE